MPGSVLGAKDTKIIKSSPSPALIDSPVEKTGKREFNSVQIFIPGDWGYTRRSDHHCQEGT